MPCNLIVLNRVDLGKAQGALLEQALKDLGFVQVYGRTYRRRGQAQSIEIRGSELVSSLPRQKLATLANQIRVAYSKRVLARTAALTGWSVRATGPNAYVMERR